MNRLKSGLSAIPANQHSRTIEIDGQPVKLIDLASDGRYKFFVSSRLRASQQPVIWRDGEKRCATCKAFKPPTTFSAHFARRDRLQTQCKACSQLAQTVREINDSNKEGGIDHQVTDSNVLAVIARANGHCEICGVEAEYGSGKHVAVDHCHNTGRIRGILCRNCNLAEGHIAATGIASAEQWGRKADAYLDMDKA